MCHDCCLSPQLACLSTTTEIWEKNHERKTHITPSRWAGFLRTTKRLSLCKQTLSQSPCTALTAGITLFMGTHCQWLLINGGNSQKSYQTTMLCCLPKMHLPVGIPIWQSHKQWHWPISSHVSYPTDSAAANRMDRVTVYSCRGWS